MAAGATLGCAADIYSQSDIILKVRGRKRRSCRCCGAGVILVGLLSPHLGVEPLAQAGVTAFAMELLPRISRAQAMDVLSSQGNIAGYKAVILAANEYGRFMPMLMTAAGTVKAARVLDPRRRRRRPPGDRHREAARRGDRSLRRPARREGAGRIARRQVRRSRAVRRREAIGAKPRAATPAR